MTSSVFFLGGGGRSKNKCAKSEAGSAKKSLSSWEPDFCSLLWPDAIFVQFSTIYASAHLAVSSAAQKKDWSASPNFPLISQQQLLFLLGE